MRGRPLHKVTQMKHTQDSRSTSTGVELKLVPSSRRVKYKTKTPAERFAKFLKRNEKGCMIFTGAIDRINFGYGRFRDRDGKIVRAHRFAWEQTNGRIPAGLMLLHGDCNDPLCCELDHLRVGTAQQNVDDMIAAGRGRAKLKAFEVLDILRHDAGGASVTEISKRIEVSEKAVLQVLRGITHGKLTGIEYKPRKAPAAPREQFALAAAA